MVGYVVFFGVMVYCVIKFVVKVISEGICRELNGEICFINILFGVVVIEFIDYIFYKDLK